MSSPPPSEVGRLLELLRGYAATQLVYVAARLDLAAQLADGARTAASLAAAVGADADGLRRVLRGLVNIGLVVEDDDGRFALTGVGATLRDSGLRGWAILTGELLYPARGGLLDAARSGATPFAQRFGGEFFDWLSQHQELATYFGGGMARETRATAAALVAAFDFTPYRTVVDVGGGHGHVLAEILRAAPDCRGILQDRQEAIAVASDRFAEAGLGERVQTVARSFFDGVIAGGDVYVLSWVLHDWSDTECLRILGHCRTALAERGPDGRLVIVESLLPDRVEQPTPIVDSDLAMLVLTGGRERTRAAFAALLERAQLRLLEVRPTPTARAVLVAAPI
jgi:hypothetical protein